MPLTVIHVGQEAVHGMSVDTSVEIAVGNEVDIIIACVIASIILTWSRVGMTRQLRVMTSLLMNEYCRRYHSLNGGTHGCMPYDQQLLQLVKTGKC